HLLIAPLTQRGRGAGPEQLRLHAVAREGVAGDEEAEDRLLTRQPLVLGPGGDIREGGRGTGDGGRLAEQRVLPRHAVLLARLGLHKCRAERRDEPGPVVAPERGPRTGVDQRLDLEPGAEAEGDAAG